MLVIINLDNLNVYRDISRYDFITIMIFNYRPALLSVLKLETVYIGTTSRHAK